MSQLKSLEVRVNSIQDAQAVASQSLKIAKAAKDSGCSIEILIDESVKLQAMPFLAGLFGPVKAYHSFVQAKKGNELYPLKHLAVNVTAPAPVKKNKGGRPRNPVLEK